MTESELIETLRHLDPTDQTALDSLAKKIVRDSRALARSTVAHLRDPDKNVARNAAALLIYLEDIAVVPLLEGPEPEAAYDRVANMTTIVDSQVELRDRIVSALDNLMDDKTPLHYTRDPRIEESPPPSRACDEAYVLLRKLMNPRENRDEQLVNSRMFLRLPEHQKDQEIEKARTSGVFSKFTGD